MRSGMPARTTGEPRGAADDTRAQVDERSKPSSHEHARKRSSLNRNLLRVVAPLIWPPRVEGQRRSAGDGSAGSEIGQSMRSGGLRHTAGVTAGIVRCRLDGRGWQELRYVGK